MSNLYYTAADIEAQDEEMELIIPTTFEEALSYAEQLIYLYYHKQNKLVEGDNITLTDNPDGTTTITATGTEGHDGVGIVSISGTITPLGTNVTVVLTDGRTQAFFVERGEKGDQGEQGVAGADGVSPVVTVVPIPGGHRVEIATPSGTPTFDVMDGAPGQPGQDGVSPTVTVTPITGGNRVAITSAGGTSTFDVMNGVDGRDGTDGQDGTDGISPTVTVRSITGGHQIEIVSAGGTERFDVMDGTNGTNGTDGISPTVTVTTIAGGHQIEIVSAGGTERFDVMDGVNGTNGTDGTDGISPTVTVRTIAGGHQIEIVSAGGTERFDVMDGTNGTNGTNGTDGVGIASITYDSTDSSGNNIYDVNLSDGTTYNITAPRGPQGPAGTSGIPTGGTPHTVLSRSSENLEVYKWSSPAYAINFNISQAPTTILGTVVSFVFRKRAALYVCSPLLTGGVQYVAIEDYSSSTNGTSLNSAIVWKTGTAGQVPTTFNGSLTASEITAIRSVSLVYPTRLRYTFSTVIVLNSSGNVVGVGTGYATAYITNASTGTYAINVAIRMITNTVANEEYTILLGM